MLRIIDANLDRLGEGLRVLEEIARFVLNDSRVSGQLKTMRHDLLTISPALKSSLLVARNSDDDVGRAGFAVEGSEREHLVDLVTANARRVQESLRVLEEFAKLPEVPAELKERGFEQARFTIYEIEKELSLRLIRQDKRDRISGIYVIIDTQALAGRNESEATRQAIRGGARIIQLRLKHRKASEIIAVARELKNICDEAGILFIVNDYMHVVLASDADGVHLGQGDFPVSLARKILPPDKIIGCSVRTAEQANKAQDEGADYLGVGSIYPSPTKPDAEVIGLERLHEIRQAVSLPIVALGGINEGNIEEVFKCGADSVAVISAVLGVDRIQDATDRLVRKFKDRCNI